MNSLSKYIRTYSILISSISSLIFGLSLTSTNVLYNISYSIYNHNSIIPYSTISNIAVSNIFLGGILFNMFNNIKSNKGLILLSTICNIIGYILITIYPHMYIIFISRIIIGIGSGSACVVVPQYIYGLCDSNKGLWCSIHPLNINIGILVGQSLVVYNKIEYWRYVYISIVVVLVSTLLASLCIVDDVSGSGVDGNDVGSRVNGNGVGSRVNGNGVGSRVNNGNGVNDNTMNNGNTLNEKLTNIVNSNSNGNTLNDNITNTVNSNSNGNTLNDNITNTVNSNSNGNLNDTSLTDNMTIYNMSSIKQSYKSMIVVSILHISQHISGIDYITIYLPKILNYDYYIILATYFLAIPSCIISSFLLNTYGRKYLYLSSVLITCISCILIVQYKVLGLILFIIGYNLGLCNIPWIIPNECTPSLYIPAMTKLGIIANWMSAYILVIVFTRVHEVYGDISFYMYSILLVCMFIYASIVVPETKGNSKFL